ncbi:MAG: lysophospholipid acyltransferase family protein [Cyclobacteriaceae bacterium]
MLRPIYLLLFKVFGWKINGHFPKNVKKFVIAVAPHTSNWDFVVGVAARSILRIQKAKFLGKSQLFRPPFGWLFRRLGGYPVDRSKRQDVVEQVAHIFDQHDDFVLALAPEGTRKKVDKLKTGFYYIAKKVGIPIYPVGFDFRKKEIIIGEPMTPSDDFEKDIEKLMVFYRGITGKNPELGF